MFLLRRAGEDEHRRRSRKQPRQRDLTQCGLVAACDTLQRLLALRLRADTSGVERKPWNEREVIALAVIDDFVPLPVDEVVLVLDRDDGYDLARALDGGDVDLRQADVAYEPLTHELGERVELLALGNLRVDSMKLPEIDAVELEAFQASFEHRAKMLGSSICDPLVRAGSLVSAFHRDDQSFGIGMQGFRDQFF